MSRAAPPVTIGIDTGSTNVKVLALDEKGEIRGRLSFPTPRTANREIDPEALHLAVEQAVLEVARGRFQISAIASAGMGEDGYVADRDLHARGAAMAWFDPRRAGAMEMTGELSDPDDEGDAAVDLDPARTVSAWALLRMEHPEQLDGDTVWISVADSPLVRWTGAAFLSDSLAARTAAWRPRQRSWISSRVDATLGSVDALPPVVTAGTIVGELRSPALREVLAPGAVAVAGGHDHVVAASAVGRALPRTVVDSMGTAEVVVVQLDGFPARRPAGVDLSPGIEHSGAALFVVHELARNVDWIRRTRPDAASSIDALLEHPTARPLPTRPVFEFGESGGREPRWLPEARELDVQDLAFRALVDCARVGAASITRLRALDGQEPTPIHAVGGWTRSRGWLALKSAVLGEPILALDETEATAVGVALIAGDALGWHQDAGRALGVG